MESNQLIYAVVILSLVILQIPLLIDYLLMKAKLESNFSNNKHIVNANEISSYLMTSSGLMYREIDAILEGHNLNSEELSM